MRVENNSLMIGRFTRGRNRRWWYSHVLSLALIIEFAAIDVAGFAIPSDHTRISHLKAFSGSVPPSSSSSGRTWTQRKSPRDSSEHIKPSNQRSKSAGSQSSSSPKDTNANSNQNPVTARPGYSRKRRRRSPTLKLMPVEGYEAEAIEEYYDRRPLQVGWRLNSIGFPLLGWYFRLLFERSTGMDSDPQVQRKQGAALREALVQSKSVALIKSGQALSLRPDLIKNKHWAEELGKLVDAVGAFSDIQAMQIIKKQLSDLNPRLAVTRKQWKDQANKRRRRGKRRLSRLEKIVAKDDILSLFEFYNGNQAVASASIGQVYKARIRRGAQLEAAIGTTEAAIWGGKTVAVKVQRPDVADSAKLDMYLLRRTAMWLSKFRGGDLPQIADAFGMQLFGELDYVREAHNCNIFRELYGDWSDVQVPEVCSSLTRKKVLVMEWVDGSKGPWDGRAGIDTVRIGLRCSVDQLMSSGVMHSDPHRGNLLRTTDRRLAYLDFGMMADIDEKDRYGLFGLVIGLQNKDLPLVTENLLKLGFLDDTTQIDLLIPRLREALMQATGGTGKASDVNFTRLQAELDNISRDNVLRFNTPAFFTIIIRSLTILEGMALSVDPSFKLVRGAYPYVLKQLLSPEYSDDTPKALEDLLIRLLTVNGEQREIEWERLRDFLRLAQKASKTYDPAAEDIETNSQAASRQTIELFGKFMMSRTGIFLKKPLVHELAEAIDGMASIGEQNLLRMSNGLFPIFPGMNGPVNTRRMDEISMMIETFQDALVVNNSEDGRERMEALVEILREALTLLSDEQLREDAGPLMAELQSVIQLVAVEVLEIRGSRAVRSLLRV